MHNRMYRILCVLAILISFIMISECLAEVEDCSATVVLSVDEYHRGKSRQFLIVDDLLYAAINIRLDDEASDNYEWITRVYCISTKGNVECCVDVPDTLADPVEYKGGIVLVASGVHEFIYSIYYISKKGKVVWQYGMSTDASFQPIQMGDNIVVIDIEGYIWEFNENGYVDKRMCIEERLTDTMITRYDNNRMVLISGNIVYFIDIHKGLKWKIDMMYESDEVDVDNEDSFIGRYPAAIFGDKILLANALGVVFVIDKNGTIVGIKKYDLKALGCEIVTYKDTVLLLSHNILILDDRMNIVRCVENTRRDSDIYITENGWILFSVRSGIVKAFNIESGKTHYYRVCKGEGMISMPIIFNDKLYAYSIGGNIYAAEVPEW